MTMLEKAARAIKLELYEQEDKARRARKRASIDTHALARAALEAIREPSEEVASVATYDEYDWAARNFTAMIDAILNEKTP
jgi:hypothetical protein